MERSKHHEECKESTNHPALALNWLDLDESAPGGDCANLAKRAERSTSTGFHPPPMSCLKYFRSTRRDDMSSLEMEMSVHVKADKTKRLRKSSSWMGRTIHEGVDVVSVATVVMFRKAVTNFVEW